MPEKTAPVERRRSPRHYVGGPVTFWWSSQAATQVAATLMDVSSGGFRASHNCRALSAGQIVRFRFSGAEGTASVVWTRVLGDSVVSGFAFVSGSTTESG